MKIILLFIFSVLSLTSLANEGTMNRLLAPGLLIQGHQFLEESRCLDCHIPTKGVKSGKCLDCHKEIKKSKFHKKHKKSCIECHSDHQGRNFDTTKINQKKFQHSKTGFDLHGKHKKIDCIKCHRTKRGIKKIRPNDPSFLEARTTCLECHQENSHHHFEKKFKKWQCSSCHSEEKWKKTKKFNHKVHTGWKLEGKHQDLKCFQCHKDQKSKWSLRKKETSCVSCHKSPHLNNFTENFKKISCNHCHNTQSWKDLNNAKDKFNHSNTSFKLTGRHQKISCKECHRPKKNPVYQFPHKKVGQCLSCHDNIHKAQFKTVKNTNNCLNCHSTHNFKELKPFKHKKTGFNLHGKHQTISCKKCHRQGTKEINYLKKSFFPGVFQFPGVKESSCLSCHNDPHLGSKGTSCVSCHSETSWKTKKNFHENFQLKGTHLFLNCQECHHGGKILKSTGDSCQTCHQKDDVHQGMLPKCNDCHTQRYWEMNNFRHSMTHFPLRGSHRSLDCKSCHANGVFSGKGTDCIDCHRSDAQRQTNPPHIMPQFESCNRCHNQFSF